MARYEQDSFNCCCDNIGMCIHIIAESGQSAWSLIEIRRVCGKQTSEWKPNIFKSEIGVSKNNGIPKSSILIGVSIINHPFWGIPIFGKTQMYLLTVQFSLHVTLPESYCTTEAPQQNIERWAFVVICKGELQRFFLVIEKTGKTTRFLEKKGENGET